MPSFFHRVRELQDLARNARTDRRAFEELYRQMADRAYGYFRRRGATPEEAEDLTQSLFVKVYRSLDSYEDTGVPFEAWFFRIARNLLIDHHRLARPTDDIEDEASLVDDAPVRDVATKLDVEACLARLPQRYQEVVHLSVYEGLSGRDLAYALGTSEENARVLKHRALKELGRLLEEAGYGA